MFKEALPILDMPGIAAVADEPTAANAKSIIGSIEQAVSLCLSEQADGMVTNPIAKHVLYDAGFKFPGHTEFLGDLSQGHATPYANGPVMMLAAQDLRVGLATVHIPLKAVATQLSKDRIVETARVMLDALETDFGLKNLSLIHI